MRPKEATRALSGGLLVLIALLAIYEAMSARRTEAAEEAARVTHGQLLERIAKLRNRPEPIERARAESEAPLSQAPLKDVDTPEQLNKRLHVLRAWMSLRYSRLYRKAGFSPEQVRQFETLLEDHYLRQLDIMATTRAEGLTSSDPAIVQMNKEEYARYSAAQTAALGSQLASAVNEDQRTAPVQEMADAVAGNTFYSQPLGTGQADQLTQILANNSASYAKGGAAKANNIDMASALAQAQAVLSPEQLSALKNLYDGNQSLKAYEAAIAAANAPH